MLLPELSPIHEQFLALSQMARDRFGESPGGRLLLRPQLDNEGIAAVVAASVAGAASLCIDADADRLREGLRTAIIDFVVASPDEALRILKNEIRQSRAISVGLTSDPNPCIDAMIERGLQPDILSGVPQPQAEVFVQRGAVSLPLRNPTEPGTSLLAWTVVEDAARTMRRVAELAAAALEPARVDTVARRRWLEHSPRYLGRSFATRQCLRMTADEITDFLSRAHAAFASAKITRDGQLV